MSEEKNRMMGPKARQPGPTPSQTSSQKKQKEKFPFIKTDDGLKIYIMTDEGQFQKMAKGGRASFKSGMKVCKLAKKGKGKAYGKNS